MDSSTPSTPPYTHLPPAAAAVVPVIVSVADDPDDLEPPIAAGLATPPSRKKPSISPSPLHLHPNRHHHGGSPHASSLHELLLLSPSHSPCRSRSRARLGAAAAMVVDDGCLEVTTLTPRRKGKSGRAAAAAAGPLGCASPRNARRARRRLEKEIGGRGEEREVGHGDDDVDRVRKRRQGRTKAAAASTKERLSLVPVPSPPPPPPPSSSLPDAENVEACGQLDGLRDLILDLVMWRNVAKSTLWFGFGSMFFLSSCFSNNLNFSIISVMCHLGILFLGLAFFRDCAPNRQQMKLRGNFQLTEGDIVRLVRFFLPFVNIVLAKAQDIFSGDPLRTLKIAPILLLGAKYGHLLTLWKLVSAGFFLCFTVPKLYSCYSQQIQTIVGTSISWIRETWKSCPRKRFIASTAAILFWNLFSVKTRIFAAFISVVIFRYHHQQVRQKESESKKEDQPQEMVVEEQGQA